MRIVKICDPRFDPLYSRNHLLGNDGCVFIIFRRFIKVSLSLLVLLENEHSLSLQRAVSNKRLSGLKVEEFPLSETKLRVVLGSYANFELPIIYEDAEDHWTLCYRETEDVRFISELIEMLSKIIVQ